MKKIKTILTAILIAIFFKNISGQTYHPFPDSNAIWNEKYTQSLLEYDTKYGLIGDTVINLTLYHKLYTLNDSVLSTINSIYFGAIREQAKKIYFVSKYCTYEVLMYDFTKNVGDTIKSLYTEISLASCDTLMKFSAVVTSVDSILINGNYRRVLHFDQTYKNPFWIEGIGSNLGLTYPTSQQNSTCICEWDLICFKQNDEVLYLNPAENSCFPSFSGIQDNSSTENSIIIFPNPINSISTISWDNLKKSHFTSLSIIDILGKNIVSFNINNTYSIKINKTDFRAGLYFAKFSEASGNYKICKLIIH